MDNRRDFLKKVMLLSGTAGASSMVPSSIQRALSINPEVGSTYLDAEHVVILMQENRSFDHCYGSLRGVRGFNDRRLMRQPDGNVVWMQSNKKGETYIPFRFDIKDTKATWMGSIPHARRTQVDANNYGRYDNWLEAKRSGDKKYREMPLTLGFYNREDLPFHYTFADAFTICDQNFCSGMTSTWPNRFFLWSGTIRGRKSDETKAFVRNTNPYDFNITPWKSFPERLEEHKISWKVYQNTLTTGGGLTGDQRSWLGNFGCNPLEFFPQYNARFFGRYYESLVKRVATLKEEIAALENKVKAGSAPNEPEKNKNDLAKKREVLQSSEEELKKWDPANFDKLTDFQKNIYKKAFVTNDQDPDFMELTTLKYRDGKEDRELPIPKGDVLYQFRKDVDEGNLPTVSWLVPSQNFSDHPSAPWFGAWYSSEILNILTKNPEVWKKTIFILTYDENDGYFDHIPPYVAPDFRDEATGKCSPGINLTGAEFIRAEREVQQGVNKSNARTAPVGLGFRVPMVIASPWSRGGKVCSQIFDHTSVLQFLEHFLNKKYHAHVLENNISEWRRTVSGDLRAVFDQYDGKKNYEIDFLEQKSFIKEIYNAKFKKSVNDFKSLTKEEVTSVNADPGNSALLVKQEPGTRVARPLPYQLYVHGRIQGDGSFRIDMKASDEVFGEAASGSPFKVYAPGKHKVAKATYKDRSEGKYEAARSWDFAVRAGEELSESWKLADFEHNQYHLHLFGPNGFTREFQGDQNDPALEVSCEYERSRFLNAVLTGDLVLKVTNMSPRPVKIKISDESYKNKEVERELAPEHTEFINLSLAKSSGWYDFKIIADGNDTYFQRFSGHVETGKESITDPVMGGVI